VTSEYRFPRDARDRVLSGERHIDLGVREEILASWDRSANSGLRHERFAAPHIRDLEIDGRLQRTADQCWTRSGQIWLQRASEYF
jgi:hypothetical protein